MEGGGGSRCSDQAGEDDGLSREVAVGMVRNGQIPTCFAVGNLLQIGHRTHEEEGG